MFVDRVAMNPQIRGMVDALIAKNPGEFYNSFLLHLCHLTEDNHLNVVFLRPCRSANAVSRRANGSDCQKQIQVFSRTRA